MRHDIIYRGIYLNGITALIYTYYNDDEEYNEEEEEEKNIIRYGTLIVSRSPCRVLDNNRRVNRVLGHQRCAMMTNDA